jgi:hypothetical protein
MSNRITIEQALFGYRDGHNLVASSVPLEPSTRHFLATVTDSSGPDSAAGFDETFTGLPVPKTDFYALFCTWPAPEMPRPGCVWSHVLLIRLTDLSRIGDLAVLPKLCKRPSIPTELQTYQKPIDFDELTLEISDLEILDLSRTVVLLKLLYDQPRDGIVLLDEECSSWIRPIFGVWSQQWPRLRREFTFSSGSLGDRRLGGPPFDLQIAPLHSDRLWRQSEFPTMMVNWTLALSEPVDAAKMRWLEVASDDLFSGSPHSLRMFLSAYGSDVSKPRAVFISLVTTFYMIALEEPPNWEKVYYHVGKTFSNPTEAFRLKKMLTTVAEPVTEQTEKAWALTSFLLTVPEASAFSENKIDLARIAPAIWDVRREQVVKLLRELNVATKEGNVAAFSNSIAKSVNADELNYIAERFDGFLPVIFQLCPRLAFEVETWRLPREIQSKILQTLFGLQLRKDEWGRIVGAMIVAGTPFSVQDATFRAGEYAIQGAFRWLESPLSNEMLPPQFWREAIETSASQLLKDNDQLSPGQLSLAAWFSSTDALRFTLNPARSDVLQLADALLEIPIPLRIPTAFLLMTIGLASNGQIALKLISKSYLTVHDALGSGNHTAQNWELLSYELPRLRWWPEWDRCERLKRGVRKWLSRNPHVGNSQLYTSAEGDYRNLAWRVDGTIDEDEFLD